MSDSQTRVFTLRLRDPEAYRMLRLAAEQRFAIAIQDFPFRNR